MLVVLEVQCVSSEVCRLILVMIAAAAGFALTCVYVESPRWRCLCARMPRLDLEAVG